MLIFQKVLQKSVLILSWKDETGSESLDLSTRTSLNIVSTSSTSGFYFGPFLQFPSLLVSVSLRSWFLRLSPFCFCSSVVVFSISLVSCLDLMLRSASLVTSLLEVMVGCEFNRKDCSTESNHFNYYSKCFI
jgi:hypothetical protein